MKKLLILITGMLLSMGASATATQYEEGKQYLVLENPVATQHPEVTEFFSFYCGACYQFDQKFHISDNIHDSLPIEVKYHKYHVSFLGGEFGQTLTQAWGIAILKNLEKEIKPLIFDGIQNKHSINNINDLRNIFVQVGMSAEEFDSLWDSFVVKSLLAKQLNAASKLGVSGVPSVYINGKYLVNQRGITSLDEFVDVTNYLITK